MKLLNIIIFLLLIIPLVSAKSGEISLLSIVGEDEIKGGIANLYLEIRPGNGGIYIDSFPLTKLDTQITTRFSNQIACNFLEVDCSKYDFFYTIRAAASIVGGPSAGAPTTILTIAVLDGLKLDEAVVITGTINSGGLIGPVGGVNEKIIAAANKGFEKVMISKWQSSFNSSLIKEELEDKITVVKITNIEEALFHFTGKEFNKITNNEIAVPRNYVDKMDHVSNILCDRTKLLMLDVDNKNNSLYNQSSKYLSDAMNSQKKRDFYSTASLCFSANLRLKELILNDKNDEELFEVKIETIRQISELDDEVENKTMRTLADLETYMIVKERLIEANEYLKIMNKTNISVSSLAYSVERAYSAKSWSEFFGLEGKELIVNKEHLEQGCLKKLAEAEERINYIELYAPGIMFATKKQLSYAKIDHKNENYALCLFKASKAKAEANILMTAIGINAEEEIDSILEEKFLAIEKIILKEELKNIFPILGYSYYEYAKTLKEEDPASSLTFSEYALELSNLDMYFPQKYKNTFPSINYREILMLGFGAIFGFLVGILVILRKK